MQARLHTWAGGPLMLFLLAILGCQSDAPTPTPNEGPTAAVPPLLATAPPTAKLDTYTEMWEDTQAKRSIKDGGGTAVWTQRPSDVVVNSPVELSVTYTVGEHGIDLGGSIFAAAEAFWGWSPPQTSNTSAAGMVTFETDAEVSLQPASGGGWAWATVGQNALVQGDKVTITYRGRADRFAGTAEFWVGVDGDGDGIRAGIQDVPTLEVIGGNATQVHLVLPTTHKPEQPLELRVSTLDQVGNTSSTGRRTIELQGLDGLTDLVLEPGVCCKKILVDGQKQGIYRAKARFNDAVYISNPMVVDAKVEPILWGDLQIHTGLSDGTGSVGQALDYADQVAGLDVAVITDHDHWGRSFLDKGDRYAQAQLDAIARRSPSFLPLVGYEWTSWVFGHRHIVDFGGMAPLASSMDPEADTPAELRTWQRGGQRLIIPHHIAGGPVAVPVDTARDPVLEPVLEVVSVHGQSVMPGPGSVMPAAPGHFAIDWLNQGQRVGFIGSTDGHDGHPGLSQLAGSQGSGGLAAIMAPDLRQVPDAIRKRKTYATNGRRIILRMTAQGVAMGGIIPAEPHTNTWTIKTKGIGTDVITNVLLHSDQGLVVSSQPNGLVFNEEWEVPPANWYFVEVQQADGGRAWSSPVTAQ